VPDFGRSTRLPTVMDGGREWIAGNAIMMT
jgi:hypothetical protein